jgi:hypothetical protein
MPVLLLRNFAEVKLRLSFGFFLFSNSKLLYGSLEMSLFYQLVNSCVCARCLFFLTLVIPKSL